MSMLFKNDKTLIKELKSGNKAAFTFLFKTYYKPLCIYCASLSKSKVFSEDIVQNTFVKIWKKREKLKIHTSIKSYLYKAVYYGFINEYVKIEKKNNVLDTIYLDTLNKSIEQDNSIIKENLIRLDKAIENLPKKCREVFILNKKEGYSYEEIADILSISKNTVENHISNALSKIRAEIFSINDKTS
ncbi:RNA polymerase sigma factor [Flavivirga spongiicola]|uniref:RNA polymerase sigma-70 factor n=1 Tax=Flavivirga spongiicola TaxID=421621 RepID=A0ABU7XNT9_9FLAO|nr:RNA polymerase sigma-70 factor [Flavivirga sp. MEBiC05379]MDO5977434.1 RNA polymerase sigma-70 factor [Flavivirga sp. MEBiC05379]